MRRFVNSALTRLITGQSSRLDRSFHDNALTKRSTIARHGQIWEWIGQVANSPDCRVLEIGSRAVVSDSLWRNVIPQASYTGFDVLPGPNVDVVGDVHRLSDYFEPHSFDLVISFAVLEHLAAPWIAAEEISKVLALGGHACIETHFSFSEHELPWHFFQFNSTALEVLFCEELGFSLVDSGLDSPIVGRFSRFAPKYLRGVPVRDLYCHSSIIARKDSGGHWEGSTEPFDWRAVTKRIASESSYPASEA
jgi:SAM-dependent methyltransferase